MNLTNDLSELLQLVSRLQTENLNLRDRLQEKNLNYLTRLTQVIDKKDIHSFYEQLSKSMGHLDSVGMIQALDGYQVYEPQKNVQCGHCEIFKQQNRDLSRRNKQLQHNQDQLLTNFQRVLQKVSQYITKQMNAIFKYGQYQNALTASVEIYNDFVQQTQIKLNTLEQNHNEDITRMSTQQLDEFYRHIEIILRNIEEEYNFRVNGSYQSRTNEDQIQTQRLKLLTNNEILQEYGKLYENNQEVTEFEMSRLIDQKISVECAELNQILLHQVDISGRTRAQSFEEKLERSGSQPRQQQKQIQNTQKKGNAVRNKVEGVMTKQVHELPSHLPSPLQPPMQTPILGGHNNNNNKSNERRSRADRVRSSQSSFSGEHLYQK